MPANPSDRVERYSAVIADGGGVSLDANPNGPVVLYDDHRAALLAAEGERDEWEKKAMALGAGFFKLATSDPGRRAETAEKHLVEVRAGVERLVREARETASQYPAGSFGRSQHSQRAANLAALLAATPSKADRASTQGGSDDVVESGGGLEPDGGPAPETSREQAVKVVVDFLDAWRFCPVSRSSAPARSCIEDAAKQLVDALQAPPTQLAVPAPEGSGDEDCSRCKGAYRSFLNLTEAELRDGDTISAYVQVSGSEWEWLSTKVAIDGDQVTFKWGDGHYARTIRPDKEIRVLCRACKGKASGTTKKQPTPSGEWPKEVLLVRNKDGGQPCFLKAEQRSRPWLPTEHDEVRRYVPAEPEEEQR